MSTGINIAPSSDITVGTTAVTSGTDGRVFFQAGGVVQQDANFTFDNTQKRLTLRAGGATASDIPFVVRNSADTFDILACYGNETTIIGRNASTEPRLIIDRAGSTKMVLGGTSNLNIQFPNSGFGQLNSGTQGWDIISSSGDIRTRNSSTSTILKGNFFGVGIANPAARLDVLAQGALSTDIAFRVRNSADTRDIFQITGDEITRVRADGNAGSALPLQIQSATNAFSTWLGLEIRQTVRAGNFSLQSQGLQNNYNNVRFSSGGYTSKTSAYITQTDTDRQGHWQFRTQVHLGDAIRTYNNSYGLQTLVIETATAPSATPADGFVQYSADITAGNAAPHFRTENGAIVKVYQETTAVTAAAFVANTSAIVDDTATFGGYTIGQVVAALKAQGLLA